ncbi:MULTISPECIES: F0F1 ATP synthase subunit B [unclassified Lactococcus]|uniref:F0F1 ATP synthase subunit B n=1 Tax=unclassified Lactococcus TaxID=2643510 RepID=UPI0011CBD63C|nr:MULTISPECIES: F0F1 ATP synthase subunit B [unclassified Lactococcus]MQW22142.1 F0F1 ATP synthase subunit B [Lactococcus sp. dk101]TXK45078.1 F0F1 ATP synthase subunit B [Lactococcus sp. dk310]TXK51142.1 F0F1 ATP synthase subunit B [Lactococcus sp. dk322]
MFTLLETAPNTVIGNVIVASGAFIILLVLLRVFAWKQITGIFEQRAKKISDDIDSAEESKVEAAKLVAQRENELAGSKAEAANIIQTANDTATQNRNKIVAAANEEAANTKKRAQGEIEQERKEALNSVKGDVANISVKIAEKLIGQSLDPQAQTELIDTYLAKIGE